jgi:hypothetical protein
VRMTPTVLVVLMVLMLTIIILVFAPSLPSALHQRAILRQIPFFITDNAPPEDEVIGGSPPTTSVASVRVWRPNW